MNLENKLVKIVKSELTNKIDSAIISNFLIHHYRSNSIKWPSYPNNFLIIFRISAWCYFISFTLSTFREYDW